MVICAERKSDLITAKKAYSRYKRFWLYCVRSEQKLSCFSEIWLRFGVNWRIVRIWVTEFWTHKKCKKTVFSVINWASLVSVIIKTKSGLISSSQFILFYFILFFHDSCVGLKRTGVLNHLTEKSGWGVESIMVSDLLGYRRVPHPLRFKSIKGANLCSVNLELTRNREIGKW